MLAWLGFKCTQWLLLEQAVEEVILSSVMELVIIISTITSFFSHFMIEKAVAANSVSVIIATFITWILIGDQAANLDAVFFRNILNTAVIALAISMIVGRVFAHHKKCS